MTKLSKSQQAAFKAYSEGKNLFIHGDAGTGKSYVIQIIVTDANGRSLNVLVVAPTGKAARNVKGKTIHSAFRVPFGIIGPEDVFQGMKDKEGLPLLELADLIVIDEISMVRYDLFAGVLRSIKKAEENSGRHKQIIVVGDFFQLPPVLTDKDEDVYREHYRDNLFAFQGGLMDGFFSVRLIEKMRQKDDAGFAEILDHLREGDAEDLPMLPVSIPSKTAVTLCARNKKADSINQMMLNKLKGHRVYEGLVAGKVEEEDKFAPEHLEIAPGAKVLMTVNDADKHWINGTEATVEECLDDKVILDIGGLSITCTPVTQSITETEIVEEIDRDGKKKLKSVQVEIGKYTQFPFKLGWAISIHKSQGMTLDEVNIDPSGCFAHGQLYVAISRCKTLQGIHLTNKPLPNHLICYQVVKEFMHEIPDYGYVKSPEKEVPDTETVGSAMADYPANNSAGEMKQDTDDTYRPEHRSIIPADNSAVLEGIQARIQKYGNDLLKEYGATDYSVRVKIVSNGDGAHSAEESHARGADPDARKAEKDARRESAARKLMDVNDPGIRQQLALLSLDAQDVYHVLHDRSVGGNVAVTADAITAADGVRISKRSVENALRELRNAGLTSSVGSKKKPVIHLTETAIPINTVECLLYRAAHSNKEISRMQAICGQCEQACPVHSNPEV